MADDAYKLHRRWVLAGLLAGAASGALAGPPETSLRPMPRPPEGKARLAPAADALVKAAKLGGADVSFVVADAKTGEILETRSPLLPQPPASVAKTITSLYALDTLGADHRFSTRLIALGTVSNGRLEGDLVLAGGGDPTLDTNRLAELAKLLKDSGLRELTGRFLIWDGALPSVSEIDPQQPDHVGYNPGLSGLNLNFNRVHFEWKRAGAGWNVAMDARSDKYRPDVRVSRMDVVNRKVPVYTYEDLGGADQWTVASGALGNGGSRWLPVRKPAAYAGEVFQILARAQGISLSAPDVAVGTPEGTVLCEVLSPPLHTILKDMLKYSTNVTAEVVGLSTSVALGLKPGSLKESALHMSEWLGQEIGSQRPLLVDHSGLGAASRISANDMVRALVEDGQDAGLRDILKKIAMRDNRGNVLKNHPAKVKAKTGTLNFVSALAGYISLPDQTELVFAIFTADTERRASLGMEQRERPEGGRAWLGRARKLQLRLIDRWSAVYAS